MKFLGPSPRRGRGGPRRVAGGPTPHGPLLRATDGASEGGGPETPDVGMSTGQLCLKDVDLWSFDCFGFLNSGGIWRNLEDMDVDDVFFVS